MAKRFAIYPGEVRSTTDGEYHFIAGGKLIELYGLDFKECYIVQGVMGEIIDPNLISLYPLASGDYKAMLERAKGIDYQAYHRARKLFDFHNNGLSPKPPEMQKVFAAAQAKAVTRYETRWPDFRAAYDRNEK